MTEAATGKSANGTKSFSFFNWLTNTFPAAKQSLSNKEYLKCDELYVDISLLTLDLSRQCPGAITDAAQHENSVTRVLYALDLMVANLRPRGMLFLAMSGALPRALHNSVSRKIAASCSSTAVSDFLAMPLRVSCTPFDNLLSKRLVAHVKERISEESNMGWNGIPVVTSFVDVPGHARDKIYNRIARSHNPESIIFVHGTSLRSVCASLASGYANVTNFNFTAGSDPAALGRFELSFGAGCSNAQQNSINAANGDPTVIDNGNDNENVNVYSPHDSAASVHFGEEATNANAPEQTDNLSKNPLASPKLDVDFVPTAENGTMPASSGSRRFAALNSNNESKRVGYAVNAGILAECINYEYAHSGEDCVMDFVLLASLFEAEATPNFPSQKSYTGLQILLEVYRSYRADHPSGLLVRENAIQPAELEVYFSLLKQALTPKKKTNAASNVNESVASQGLLSKKENAKTIYVTQYERLLLLELGAALEEGAELSDFCSTLDIEVSSECLTLLAFLDLCNKKEGQSGSPTLRAIIDNLLNLPVVMESDKDITPCSWHTEMANEIAEQVKSSLVPQVQFEAAKHISREIKNSLRDWLTSLKLDPNSTTASHMYFESEAEFFEECTLMLTEITDSALSSSLYKLGLSSYFDSQQQIQFILPPRNGMASAKILKALAHAEKDALLSDDYRNANLTDERSIAELFKSFVLALQWNILRFQSTENLVPSWSFYYPYAFPPSLEDLAKLTSYGPFDLTFVPDQPTTSPLEGAILMFSANQLNYCLHNVLSKSDEMRNFIHACANNNSPNYPFVVARFDYDSAKQIAGKLGGNLFASADWKREAQLHAIMSNASGQHLTVHTTKDDPSMPTPNYAIRGARFGVPRLLPGLSPLSVALTSPSLAASNNLFGSRSSPKNSAQALELLYTRMSDSIQNFATEFCGSHVYFRWPSTRVGLVEAVAHESAVYSLSNFSSFGDSATQKIIRGENETGQKQRSAAYFNAREYYSNVYGIQLPGKTPMVRIRELYSTSPSGEPVYASFARWEPAHFCSKFDFGLSPAHSLASGSEVRTLLHGLCGARGVLLSFNPMTKKCRVAFYLSLCDKTSQNKPWDYSRGHAPQGFNSALNPAQATQFSSVSLASQIRPFYFIRRLVVRNVPISDFILQEERVAMLSKIAVGSLVVLTKDTIVHNHPSATHHLLISAGSLAIVSNVHGDRVTVSLGGSHHATVLRHVLIPVTRAEATQYLLLRACLEDPGQQILISSETGVSEIDMLFGDDSSFTVESDSDLVLPLFYTNKRAVPNSASAKTQFAHQNSQQQMHQTQAYPQTQQGIRGQKINYQNANHTQQQAFPGFTSNSRASGNNNAQPASSYSSWIRRQPNTGAQNAPAAGSASTQGPNARPGSRGQANSSTPAAGAMSWRRGAMLN